MPYVFGGSSGGGGGVTPTIAFLGSQDWTPAFDLEAYVYVIGGGGSGAAVCNSNNPLLGGGAGGCAISKLSLASGTTYTVTIGAGGARVSTTSSSAQSGNAGGASSFSGSGISTMTGNGGTGGTGLGSNTTAGNGGAGGTATGGTLANFTGGKGGRNALTDGSNRQRTGGGAVGLWATGNDGADAVSATENQWLHGGNLNYDLGTYSQSEIFNQYTTYLTPTGTKTLPSIAAFGSYVTSHDSIPADLSGSGGSFYGSLNERKMPGQPPDRAAHWTSSNYYGGVAPPFHGGSGWLGAANIQQGESASLGGGGGACGTRGGIAGTSISGEGGTGAVLIFPISLGS
tara:strand:+ start:370 stop:1398 length:1029 start_codon:yes stop_codon:yes gene_type:complete